MDNKEFFLELEKFTQSLPNLETTVEPENQNYRAHYFPDNFYVEFRDGDVELSHDTEPYYLGCICNINHLDLPKDNPDMVQIIFDVYKHLILFGSKFGGEKLKEFTYLVGLEAS